MSECCLTLTSTITNMIHYSSAVIHSYFGPAEIIIILDIVRSCILFVIKSPHDFKFGSWTPVEVNS